VRKFILQKTQGTNVGAEDLQPLQKNENLQPLHKA